MSLRRTALALLTASAAASFGCTEEDAFDPATARGDFDIEVHLEAPDGYESARVDATADAQVVADAAAEAAAGGEDLRVGFRGAVIRREAVELPDPPDGTSLDVNGSVDDEVSMSKRGWLIASPFDSAILPAPGEPLDITFTAPGAVPVTKSIPMVQSAELTAPVQGDEISRGTDLEVTWSSSALGESDWIVLHVVGSSYGSDMEPPRPSYAPLPEIEAPRAADSATSAIVPGSKIGQVYDEFMASSDREMAGVAPGSPVHGYVRLFRMRTTSNAPDFASGETRLRVEIARVRVLIAP